MRGGGAALLRRYALPAAMAAGATCHELFARVPQLRPLGGELAPWATGWLPAGLFALLYVTFCRIDLSQARPRAWHFAVQGARCALSAAAVVAITLCDGHPAARLVMEGVFVCLICPTASAVAVVAEKLGGSIGSLTMFTMIANAFTMVIIPLLFPLVERAAHLTFLTAMLLLLRNVTLVLVAPLALALLSRRLLPGPVRRLNRLHDTGFWLWCANLSVVTGVTVGNIERSAAPAPTLALLLLAPLAACLAQFALGKAIGSRWGDRVSAGQALGQKNTVVGIWLTMAFLNPLAAVAPGAYVLWQNLVNGWQLWYMEKHGKLRW